MLEEREMERLVRLEELRKEIMIGIEASDRGVVVTGLSELLAVMVERLSDERQQQILELARSVSQK